MHCPMYHGVKLPNTRPESGNSGLWYDKFCNTWKVDFSGFEDENGKKKWIDNMTSLPVGNKELLREINARKKALVSACAGKDIKLTSNSVLVSGLGQSHPVENGFSWHHTLGVPYLPGSSIKGMVRSWASWLNEPENEISRICGPRGNGAKKVGSVIFLDALPIACVQLKMEIMTPHYDPWYQKGEAPGDWHDPNPIPFLAVAAGQSFSFAVLPSNRIDQQAIADCNKALDWLTSALINTGVGAKTAVGFGRFDPPSHLQMQAAEEVWEGAILSYSPGNSKVSAKAIDGRIAEAINPQQGPLISDEIIGRIKKMKNKGVKARVTVTHAGGKSFTLLRVEIAK